MAILNLPKAVDDTDDSKNNPVVSSAAKDDKSLADNKSNNDSAAKDNSALDDKASVDSPSPAQKTSDSSDMTDNSSSNDQADSYSNAAQTLPASRDNVSDNFGMPRRGGGALPSMSRRGASPLGGRDKFSDSFGSAGMNGLNDDWDDPWSDPWGDGMGGKSDKKRLTPEERVKMIESLYEEVLSRKPDTRDINYYKYSTLGEEEIRKQLITGKEHKQLIEDGREYKKVLDKSNKLESRVKVLEGQIKDQLEEFKQLSQLLKEKNNLIMRIREKIGTAFDTNNHRIYKSGAPVRDEGSFSVVHESSMSTTQSAQPREDIEAVPNNVSAASETQTFSDFGTSANTIGDSSTQEVSPPESEPVNEDISRLSSQVEEIEKQNEIYQASPTPPTAPPQSVEPVFNSPESTQKFDSAQNPGSEPQSSASTQKRGILDTLKDMIRP